MMSQQSMDMGTTLMSACTARVDAAIAYGATVAIKWHEVVVGDGNTGTLTGNSNQTKIAALTGCNDYAISHGVTVTDRVTYIRSIRAISSPSSAIEPRDLPRLPANDNATADRAAA